MPPLMFLPHRIAAPRTTAALLAVAVAILALTGPAAAREPVRDLRVAASLAVEPPAPAPTDLRSPDARDAALRTVRRCDS